MTESELKFEFEEAADKLADEAATAVFRLVSGEWGDTAEIAKDLKTAGDNFRKRRRELFAERDKTIEAECVDGEGHRPSDVLKVDGRPICRACGIKL